VPPGQLPVADGYFTINLRIRESYDTVAAAGEAPDWLGEKELRARFCNTLSSQNFTETIEDETQRRFQLTSVGRMSPERGTVLSIAYGGVFGAVFRSEDPTPRRASQGVAGLPSRK
jgi:hypothetical protein